ncbi:flagellar basal body L-ring protein FlgH [Candidatus Poribacteria bacterium]|nr:flagellar basal body L-ring protein FlgH [Candidatus Poribacteria bacterium]
MTGKALIILLFVIQSLAFASNKVNTQLEGYSSLYQDHKARKVGDIITVLIVESSKASKSAATQTSKKSGSDGTLSELFGLGNLPISMGVDAGSDYSGSGTTTRSGNMEGKMSTFVKEVMPNGNLILEGTRQVIVNDDVQMLTVQGVIRPESIGPDNTVLSIYIADAKITYQGDGPTAQKPGIVTRIIQTPFHWAAGIFRRLF